MGKYKFGKKEEILPYLIVDFHRRKKGGAEVPPLRLPLNWYGIDKIVLSARIALSCRPKEKAVYVYKNGKRVRIVKRDMWVFPRIQSTKAWEIAGSHCKLNSA